jgi:hypothetical protein
MPGKQHIRFLETNAPWCGGLEVHTTATSTPTSLLKKRLLHVSLEKHRLPLSRNITQRSELMFLRIKNPALVKSLQRARGWFARCHSILS